MSPRRILGKLALYLAAFVIVSPAILFFLWMLSLSLKFEIDNAAYPPVFIPENFAWKNYTDVLASNRFLTYFVNSLLVTGGATGLAMLVGVPAGYGIARMAAHKSAIVILIARITPGPVISDPAVPAVPVARPARHAGAADHHPSGGDGADRDLDHDRLFRDHAAGTGRGGADRRRDALAGVPPCRAADRAAGARVAFILAVIFSWNNFVFGIVLAGRETRTLPVAVYNMISFDQLSWGPLAAAALIVTLPVLLLTVFAQRQIVAGLTAGRGQGRVMSRAVSARGEQSAACPPREFYPRRAWPSRARYWWTKAIAMLPSPTAAATRLIGLRRTSPQAKYAGDAGFEQIGIAVVRPAIGLPQIVSGQHVPLRIARDVSRQPFGLGVGADEDEQPGAVVAAHLVAGVVADMDGGQVGFAMDGVNLRPQRGRDVRLAAQLLDQIVRHALFQGIAPDDQRHLAGVVGEV